MAKTETKDAEDGAAGAEVQEAELPQAAESDSSAPAGQVGVLLDTSLPIEVHLGQVRTRVRELLRLGPGAVLKLDKQVGEPVDLYLRDSRFATGQLVVVGDRLGVRIQEIVSPQAAHRPDDFA